MPRSKKVQEPSPAVSLDKTSDSKIHYITNERTLELTLTLFDDKQYPRIESVLITFHGYSIEGGEKQISMLSTHPIFNIQALIFNGFSNKAQTEFTTDTMLYFLAINGDKDAEEWIWRNGTDESFFLEQKNKYGHLEYELDVVERPIKLTNSYKIDSLAKITRISYPFYARFAKSFYKNVFTEFWEFLTINIILWILLVGMYTTYTSQLATLHQPIPFEISNLLMVSFGIITFILTLVKTQPNNN